MGRKRRYSSRPVSDPPTREERCVGYGCSEKAMYRHQLCREHQDRLIKGGGLPLPGEPKQGDPSGHGQLSIVDRNQDGVLCHECGHRFALLGLHVRRTHGMTVRDYRRKHRIPSWESLRAEPHADGAVRRRARKCSCGKTYTTYGKRCGECRKAAGYDIRKIEEPSADD